MQVHMFIYFKLNLIIYLYWLFMSFSFASSLLFISSVCVWCAHAKD